eukprot:254171-Chlamydomonas_euryale.AAC.6
MYVAFALPWLASSRLGSSLFCKAAVTPCNSDSARPLTNAERQMRVCVMSDGYAHAKYLWHDGLTSDAYAHA